MEKRSKIVEVWIARDGTEHTNAFKAEEHERKLDEVKTQTMVEQSNLAALQENTRRVRDVRERWEIHPEEREAFIAEIRRKHQATIELGVELGWWEGATPDGTPIAPATVVKISELEPHETLMAHVVAKLGFFKSVSEARKNGWDKPIEKGEFWFRKKASCLRIVD